MTGRKYLRIDAALWFMPTEIPFLGKIQLHYFLGYLVNLEHTIPCHAFHKSNPSFELRGVVDTYSTLPWVTWEVITRVEVVGVATAHTG
jgi:hypothetical protein